MWRHTIVVWTDDDADSWLVDWTAESIDGPEVVKVLDHVESRGTALRRARYLSSVATLVAVYGPVKAELLAQAVRVNATDEPTLF